MPKLKVVSECEETAVSSGLIRDGGLVDSGIAAVPTVCKVAPCVAFLPEETDGVGIALVKVGVWKHPTVERDRIFLRIIPDCRGTQPRFNVVVVEMNFGGEIGLVSTVEAWVVIAAA